MSLPSDARPRIAATFALCTCVSVAACAPRVPASVPTAPARATLAITGVTIVPIEGDTAPAAGPHTVLVDGDTIVSVAPSASARVPAGATVIDGRGKFLIPGMADMHLHLPDDPTGAELRRVAHLLVANGVTTARGMNGAPSHLAFRERERREDDWIPTLVLAGPPVADKLTPDEARALVRAQKAAGYDLIKIIGGIDRAAYDAIVDEARRAGIPVAGHVPPEIGLDAALAAHQATIEHLGGYLAALKTNPDALAALAARTREAGVWNCPTLDFFGVALDPDGPDGPDGPGGSGGAGLERRAGLRFATDAELADWRKEREKRPQGGAALLQQRYRVTLALARAGAGLLVGSDSPGSYRVPGFSYVEELRRMRAAGLSPREVLHAATRGAAVELGLGARAGLIAPGHRADLVLLDKNPLDDIAHVADPAGVVVRGRWLSRDEARRLIEPYARRAP